MSWIPPSTAGIYDPQSEPPRSSVFPRSNRHHNRPHISFGPSIQLRPVSHAHTIIAGRYAPRPAAAAPAFTFGHLEERQQRGADAAPPAAAPGPGPLPISQRPNKASFDPPAEQLRWWQQPRSAATVSGSCNRDVEVYWEAAAAQHGAVKALANAEARRTNKAQGVGSTVAASLGDRQEFDLTGEVQSLYKSDLCAGHLRVGKRGVVQPAAAMQAVSNGRAGADMVLVWHGRWLRMYWLNNATPCRLAVLCLAPLPFRPTPLPHTPSSRPQYEESRKQAEQNKLVGRATNMKLSLF